MWTGQQHLLSFGGISSFGEDQAGELYVTGYFDGTINRLDPVDSDADLLPDWWELAYFGSTTGATANVDADGDTAANLSEYLSGTDPLNAQSAPASSPFVAPEITSANAIDLRDRLAVRSLTVTATGRFRRRSCAAGRCQRE